MHNLNIHSEVLTRFYQMGTSVFSDLCQGFSPKSSKCLDDKINLLCRCWRNVCYHAGTIVIQVVLDNLPGFPCFCSKARLLPIAVFIINII